MKRVRFLVLVLIVLSSFLFNGCQTRSDQASPIQLYVASWDPLVGTTHTDGTYEAQSVTIQASFNSDAPVFVAYAVIKEISIEAYVGATKVSSFSVKTDFMIAANNSETFDSFPLNWTHLNSYLGSHGAVSAMTFKVFFKGEDSGGKSLLLESEFTVMVS
ncbi:MAG: hypothetical protein PHV06_07205 [bacterium]|nr:hypothetical protein [bacterium]